MGRLKKFFAETAEKFYVLVSRDDAMGFYKAARKERDEGINTKEKKQ